MTDKKRNPLRECMDCWRRHSMGIPPVLPVSLVVSVLCWVFGAAAVACALAGVLFVLIMLQHMKNTPEE